MADPAGVPTARAGCAAEVEALLVDAVVEVAEDDVEMGVHAQTDGEVEALDNEVVR